MANEIYPFPNHTIRAEVEATYNADPSVVAADTKTVLEATINSFLPTMVERNGIVAPKRAGAKRYKGTTRAEWSVTSELQYAPLVATEPDCHEWLIASGFSSATTTDADYLGPFHSAGASGTDDQIRTYSLLSKDPSTNSSIEIHYDQLNQDDSKAYHQKITGARCDWTLSAVSGETVKLSCDGSGIGTEATDYAVTSGSWTIGSAMDVTQTLTTADPVVCLGTKFKIEAIAPTGSSDVIYGSISMLNTLRSLEISGNMNLVEDLAFNNTAGIARVRHAPSEPITASMQLELVAASEFDFEAYMSEGWLIQSTIVFISGSNVIEVYFPSIITGMSRSESDGIIVVDLDLAGVWDEVSPDGGYDDGGGRVPADDLTIKFIGVV